MVVRNFVYGKDRIFPVRKGLVLLNEDIDLVQGWELPALENLAQVNKAFRLHPQYVLGTPSRIGEPVLD